MTYHLTERGFKHYEPIATDYGHQIRVYESSAAREPCIWLKLELTAENRTGNLEPEEATAHLTIEQAEQVRDSIDAAIKSHYQLEAS